MTDVKVLLRLLTSLFILLMILMSSAVSTKIFKLIKFLILGSAHNSQEIIIKQRQGCKLIFLAPIFKVNKKKHFLGVNKFNQLTTNKKIDFIALGGINDLNIKKINLLNCYGFAGISWIKKNGLRKLRPFLNCLNNY